MKSGTRGDGDDDEHTECAPTTPMQIADVELLVCSQFIFALNSLRIFMRLSTRSDAPAFRIV